MKLKVTIQTVLVVDPGEEWDCVSEILDKGREYGESKIIDVETGEDKKGGNK